MTKLVPAALFIFAASVVGAEETRQMEAHAHGVGQLDIAFEGNKIAMALHAPGADIVGFEYVAESAGDRAKLDQAVATLARPLDLFILPAAAACSVVHASASLDSEEGHDEHAQEEYHTEFHAEYVLNCADPAQATLITFAYFDTFPSALELEVQVISDRGATAFEVERDAPTLDLRDIS